MADPTASEAVAYIRKEAQRLVELLNQLLDFGQVEQGVDVPDGGQQHVTLEQRSVVEEPDEALGLEHGLCRNLPRDDPAEEAVGLVRQRL